MHELRRDHLRLLVLLKRLGVKPHQFCLTHVRQERRFILLGNILPIRVMLPMIAKLMGIVALSFMCAEIQTDFVLQLAFLGKGLDRGSSFVDVEESHFEALVGELLPRFFLTRFISVGFVLVALS